MEQEKIDRINHLARKSRTVGLTREEQEEQRVLRLAYVAAFRESLTGQLDHTWIVDEQGNRKKLQKKRGKDGTDN